MGARVGFGGFSLGGGTRRAGGEFEGFTLEGGADGVYGSVEHVAVGWGGEYDRLPLGTCPPSSSSSSAYVGGPSVFGSQRLRPQGADQLYAPPARPFDWDRAGGGGGGRGVGEPLCGANSGISIPVLSGPGSSAYGPPLMSSHPRAPPDARLPKPWQRAEQEGRGMEGWVGVEEDDVESEER
jgi:hypothetical protein